MMKKLVKTFEAIVKMRLKKITKSNLVLIKQVAKTIIKKSLQQKNVGSPYTFPNWMKQLLEPTVIFDQSLLTYQEVIKIIGLHT